MKLVATWAAAILAWELAYRILDWKPWVFPAPSHVLEAFQLLLSGGVRAPLPSALVVSCLRVALGFAISLVTGAILGAAMWRFRRLDALLGGVCLGLQTLPSVCWVPIAVLTLGLNELGILFVVVMGSFFAIATAMRDGLRSIPPIYLKAGRMLGARGIDFYRYVMLPASLPPLASGLRQGFTFAWRSLMGAELIFMLKAHGVGYLLHQGREFADVAQVVALMILMVLVGMVVDRYAFAVLERRVRHRFGLEPTR